MRLGAKCPCEMGEGITEDKMETISIRLSVLSVWQLAGKGRREGGPEKHAMRGEKATD